MKPFAQSLAAALVAVLLVVAIPGCFGKKPLPDAKPAAPMAPKPADTKKLVSSHHQRETVQWKAAERINEVVTGTSVEEPVKEQTGIIVQANKDASAADLEAHLAAFTAATKAFEAQREADAATIARQAERIKALEDAELRATAKTLRGWGISLVLIGVGLAVGVKLIPLGATVGGAGFLLLSAAQLWVKVASHPWFDLTVGALIIGILAAIVWSVVHAYKKGDLTKKALREKDRLTETLKVIVPVLDDAKSQLGDAFKPVLNRLSSGMDYEEKQLVKQIRAQADA